MSSPEHAESEATAFRHFNPMRYPWKRMRVWQSAIYSIGWLLTWVGGLALVLLGAYLGNAALTIFGAGSLLLFGPVLLWLSDRFVAQLPTTKDPLSAEPDMQQQSDQAAVGESQPLSHKTKPKPKPRD